MPNTAPLAIMSAMDGELRSVLAQLDNATPVRVAGRDFWVGHWHGQPVVAVLSRIGKVAAATTATAMLERFGVARLLFTGVAGGLGPGVRVGDVVVATHFLQHDMDASPLFPRHEVPLYGQSRFAADAPLCAALSASVRDVLAQASNLLGEATLREFGMTQPRLHTGLVLSGDRFVATTTESQALREVLPDALAVEMECAAVAQVCHDYGVPFAAVRTISDRADDSAHHDFNRFMAAVASRYSEAIVAAYLLQHTSAAA